MLALFEVLLGQTEIEVPAGSTPRQKMGLAIVGPDGQVQPEMFAGLGKPMMRQGILSGVEVMAGPEADSTRGRSAGDRGGW